MKRIREVTVQIFDCNDAHIATVNRVLYVTRWGFFVHILGSWFYANTTVTDENTVTTHLNDVETARFNRSKVR